MSLLFNILLATDNACFTSNVSLRHNTRGRFFCVDPLVSSFSLKK